MISDATLGRIARRLYDEGMLDTYDREAILIHVLAGELPEALANARGCLEPFHTGAELFGAISTAIEAANSEPTCTCGHARAEHSGDIAWPGSSECERCSCVSYETRVVDTEPAPAMGASEQP